MDLLILSEILREANYPVRQSGNYLQIPALWRGGSDPTSVAVYPNDNTAKDFVEGEVFGIDELFRRVFSLPQDQNIEDFLKNKNYNVNFEKPKQESLIKEDKVYDIKILDNLVKCHDYWINRGIPVEIIQEFRGGIATEGKLKSRYVFPIINSKNQVIGFSARDITGKSPIKWKTIGQKKDFCYPCHINLKDIRSKNSVIIVESIGNALALFASGYRNVMVTFGTEISFSIVNVLLKINIGKIILSTDNDESGVGQEAARKMNIRLSRYFDNNKIETNIIKGYKDWSEMFEKEGKIRFNG